MILMSLTIVNALFSAVYSSVSILMELPSVCFFLLNFLLSLTEEPNVCGEKSQEKQSQHPALKYPLPYKVGGYF